MTYIQARYTCRMNPSHMEYLPKTLPTSSMSQKPVFNKHMNYKQDQFLQMRNSSQILSFLQDQLNSHPNFVTLVHPLWGWARGQAILVIKDLTLQCESINLIPSVTHLHLMQFGLSYNQCQPHISWVVWAPQTHTTSVQPSISTTT